MTYAFAVLISRNQEQSQTKNVILSGFLIILTIMIIGSNETSMFILYLVFSFVIMINLIIKKRFDTFLFILLIVATIGSLIVILAPGNQIRTQRIVQEHLYPTNPDYIHNVIHASILSIKTTFRKIIYWLRNLPLIVLFAILYMPVGQKNEYRIFSIHPLISFVIMITLIVASYFPSYWATNYIEARVENISYFIFLLLFFLNIQVINNWLIYRNLVSIRRLPKYIIVIICSLTILWILPFNTIRIAYDDLFSERAYLYNRQLERRYKILDSRNDASCTVRKLDYHPVTIFHGDITSDEKHWINTCTANYFKKKAIRINGN